MTVLDKLERRLGWIAIPSLVRIMVMFSAFVCVLAYTEPQLLSLLDLKPEMIKRGEVWRLVTYIFIPQSPVSPGAMFSPFFAVMALWFLWWIGDGLERAWGAFRLTLYILVGMIGTTLAAFLFHAQFSNGMLASTIFFAFAWFYPEEVIYVLFILPVKIKWLAWISAAFLVASFILGSWAERISMLLAFSNYWLFFGPEIFQQARHRKDVTARRTQFEVRSGSAEEPLHRCATCDATELSDANLEFRVSPDGEEYCLAHLPSATAVSASKS